MNEGVPCIEDLLNQGKFLMEIQEPKKEEKDDRVCKCGSIFRENGNDLVCINCGITRESVLLNSGMEVNGVGREKVKDGGSLSIKASKTKKDVNKKLEKMTQWNSATYTERRTWEIDEDIRTKMENKGIEKKYINMAIELFGKMYKKMKESKMYKTKRGKELEGLKGACVYQIFKKEGINRTYYDISKMMEVEQKYVIKGTNLLMLIMKNERLQDDVETTSIEQILTVTCGKLRITDQMIKKRTMKVIRENEYPNNNNQTIAVGTLWYILNESGYRVDKERYIRSTGVSVATVDRIYKKLKKIDEDRVR